MTTTTHTPTPWAKGDLFRVKSGNVYRVYSICEGEGYEGREGFVNGVQQRNGVDYGPLRQFDPSRAALAKCAP